MVKHDVFLSYSHEDSDKMLELKKLILGGELTVWTDEGIPVGEPSWKNAVETAIENAGCVVALFSPSSKKSDWVKKELSYAKSQKKTIIPILIKGDESNAIPLDFIDYQYLDVRMNNTKVYEVLLPTLRELVDKTEIDPRQAYFISSGSRQETRAISEAVKSAVAEVGFKLVAFFDLPDAPFAADTLEGIRSSAVIIIDLSVANANTYCEYGYARGVGKKIIPIAKLGSHIGHIDIRTYRIVYYHDPATLRNNLRNLLVHGLV